MTTVNVPGLHIRKDEVSAAIGVGNHGYVRFLVDQTHLGVGHDAVALVDHMAADGRAGRLRQSRQCEAPEHGYNCD
jgi:hypothetical protein